MKRVLWGVCLLLGCGGAARLKPVDVTQPEEVPPVSLPVDAGEGLVEAPVPDAGAPEVDAGVPDAGVVAPGLAPSERATVAAGAMFSCALSGGDVYCWGENGTGQLGNGTRFNSSTPVKVLGVSGAVEVSAGYDHACALGSNGRIWCWGANGLGQLGRGTQTGSESPDFVLGLINMKQISAGAQGHSCGLTVNGLVTCWGRGLTNTAAPQLTPLAVAGLTGVLQVAAGDHHVCALLPQGAVQCWGGNYFGVLGDGTKVDRAAPAAVIGLPPAGQLAAGNGYTCAISGADVWCWGRGESGQLGTSTQPEVLLPQKMLGATGDRVIVSQGLHTCLRETSGAVGCLGSNGAGQLGNGQSGLTPELTPVSTGITDAVGGSAGTFHTCVRRASGAVACWGINSAGQLGDGHSGTLSMAPVQVVGLP